MSLFSDKILEIALPVPLRRTFDYLAVDENGQELEDIESGCRVVVPFGRQSLVGIVITTKTGSEFPIEKLKPVKSLLDQHPCFAKVDITLIHWAAKYYQQSLGDVYHAALPKLLREGNTLEKLQDKKLVSTEQLPEQLPANAKAQQKLKALFDTEAVIDKAILKEAGISTVTVNKFLEAKWADWQTYIPESKQILESDIIEPLQLNTEQAIAVSAINSSTGFNTYLLDGITGSGKTEVYLQAIAKVLLEQKQVMVLVPEIGLTPQTIERFRSRFNVEVALWHSNMTDKQRFKTWQMTRSGIAKIVIATRSGVFLPFFDLGMIVMDEEHDASFKQQDGFKYHCRSIALYRANLIKVPVILGTATPSLESLANAVSGRFRHLKLKQRAGNRRLPKMQLLDLNRCKSTSGIGEPLQNRVQQVLADGKQAMLFINRRGYAPVLMCEECHWLTDCHRCSGFTTYHKTTRQLICHHCGNQQPTVHQCQGCGSTRLTTVGVGTEQLELYLAEAFPEANIVRLDRDSTARKGEFENKLEQIQQGKAQIIIGTQMVAKGHHFPNVNLVGILDVDGALFSSDFRAPEKLAQLVVQVAGRAGRGDQQGEVWLQTKFPEHPVIQDLVNNQYADFAQFALTERKDLALPPYSHQVVLRAEATQSEFASEWLANLTPHLSHFEQLLVLGPMPAPMSKKAGKFRHMLTLQCQSRGYLHKVVDWLIENLDSIQNSNRIRWSIDVDPVDLS